MDLSTAVSTAAYDSIKNKFFDSLAKWYHKIDTEKVTANPDTPNLIYLLQGIGFQLRKLEKLEVTTQENNDDKKESNLQVSIECSYSGMKAVLEMQGVNCQCPDPNEEHDPSFWSISGTGPVSGSTEDTNKVEEAGSNLLPSISKEITELIHDIIYRLFKTIDETAGNSQSTEQQSTNFAEGPLEHNLDRPVEGNIEQSPTEPKAQLTGHHIFEIPTLDLTTCLQQDLQQFNITTKDETPCFDTLTTDYARPSLMEHSQNPWMGNIEMQGTRRESRSSSPGLSSSPVSVLDDLRSSLERVSLDTDDASNIARILLRMHQDMGRAMQILLDKLTDRNQNVFARDTFVRPSAQQESSFQFNPRFDSQLETTSRRTSLPGRSGVYRPAAAIQKSLIRKNSGPTFARKFSDRSPILNTSPRSCLPRVPLQRRSIGTSGSSSTQEVNVTRGSAPKIVRDTSSSLPSSSGSGERVYAVVRKRVSPESKDSSSQIDKPNVSPSVTLTKTATRLQKLSTSETSKGASKGASGSSANKFGFTKKL